MRIQVENLKKKYNDFELDIPNLEIGSGEIFGLVGNNGAGKTTILRLILDLIQASDGKIFSNNLAVAKSEKWKEYTGSYLDPGFLIGFLTANEYFDFVASLHDMPKENIEKSLNRFEKIFNNEILGSAKYIRDMSTGNMQKIGISASMLFYPKLIILDEPFANLDPSSRKGLNNILLEENRKNDTTIIISSHDIANIADLCSRIAILENGKIIKNLKTNEKTLDELNKYFQ